MIKEHIEGVDFSETESLEKVRFDFVEDEILKENLAINMQYVIFLYALEDNFNLSGSLSYSVFRTIIVSVASIIEGLLNDKLRQLFRNPNVRASKIMGSHFDYVCFKKKDIPLSEKEVIVAGIKRVKKAKKLKNDTNFNDLNKAAKKVGLFQKSHFEEAEKLRKKRNEIHLAALGRVSEKYTKKELDQLFKDAKVLIDRIRDYQIQ